MKLTVSQLVKKSPLFYETQNPKVCCCLHKSLPLNSYYQPDDSIVHFPSYFFRIHSPVLQPTPCPSSFFPLFSPPKPVCIHAMYTVHLIHLLLITQTMFGEDTNHAGAYCLVLSTFLLFLFSQIQMCSSTPFSWTRTAYVIS